MPSEKKVNRKLNRSLYDERKKVKRKWNKGFLLLSFCCCFPRVTLVLVFSVHVKKHPNSLLSGLNNTSPYVNTFMALASLSSYALSIDDFSDAPSERTPSHTGHK